MRYTAKHAFGVMFQGEHVTIAAGQPVSDQSKEGKKLLKQLGAAGVAEHLEPYRPQGPFDVEDKVRKPAVRKPRRSSGIEQATAAPGEKRVKK